MTNKMMLAEMINRYETLSNYDVQTVGMASCISGCRRLRDLAVEYCKRKNAASAYEYRDNYYFFRKGFSRFCGVWLREQIKKLAKNDRRAEN